MIHTEVIKKIIQVLKEKNDFAILGHVRPDGDCLGSQLALYMTLKEMGKNVRLFNAGPILEHYKFLPNIELIKDKWERASYPEVLIFIDCGEKNRVYENFEFSGFSINIDHHQKNHGFADLNYVDTEASAVGEQIFRIIQELKTPLTTEIASCLYLSLLADTGSFRFSNTSERVFKVAAALVEAGASPSKIAAAFYENLSVESIQLTAKVLTKLKIECDGKLVWSEITQDEYRQHGGEINEPEGLVSTMRSMRGVIVSVLIHELEEGGLRAGFRSKNCFDVSKIARKLGGGGHINASGCYIKGDYETLKKIVIETLKQEISNLT